MIDDPQYREPPLKQFGYAPGNYMCVCRTCGDQHTADKRAWRCEKCAAAMAQYRERLARRARDAYCRQMLEPIEGQDWETYGLAWESAVDAIRAEQAAIERETADE